MILNDVGSALLATSFNFPSGVATCIAEWFSRLVKLTTSGGIEPAVDFSTIPISYVLPRLISTGFEAVLLNVGGGISIQLVKSINLIPPNRPV